MLARVGWFLLTPPHNLIHSPFSMLTQFNQVRSLLCLTTSVFHSMPSLLLNSALAILLFKWNHTSTFVRSVVSNLAVSSTLIPKFHSHIPIHSGYRPCILVVSRWDEDAVFVLFWYSNSWSVFYNTICYSFPSGNCIGLQTQDRALWLSRHGVSRPSTDCWAPNNNVKPRTHRPMRLDKTILLSWVVSTWSLLKLKLDTVEEFWTFLRSLQFCWVLSRKSDHIAQFISTATKTLGDSRPSFVCVTQWNE